MRQVRSGPRAAWLRWGGWARVPGSWSPLLPTDSNTKTMVTEMSLGEADFQELQAQEGVAVTFCLKEFRVSPYPPIPPSRARCVLPACSQGDLTARLFLPGAPELC